MFAPFVRRVRLKNYKSIAACDVQLDSLTFLVGPNGSGKSNFLDALRLVADGLNFPLDHAVRERGGIDDVRRRSTGHPHNFGIALELILSPQGTRAFYGFEVAAKTSGAFDIKKEHCRISSMPANKLAASQLPLPASGFETEAAAEFVVQRGEIARFSASLAAPPAASPDRLFLVALSGVREFRPLFDALSSMSFYNLNPGQIREVQPPDPGRLLARDGRNLASVLGRLESEAPESVQGIREYLTRIVPDIREVQREPVANKETLLFRQQVKGSSSPWKFFANAMSDGTLRALGVLTALAQGKDPGRPIPLVAIEEPEAALHPAAASVLFEALQDAARSTQVIVTSHSPDLLDNESIQENQILAVTVDSGLTVVGPISDVGRRTLRDHLYTPGELLRMSQLEPDEPSRALHADQLDLFAIDEP